MDKSLFVGGGWIDSQLLTLIILLDSYSTENNIETWIFESPISPRISQIKIISSILKKRKIIVLPSFSKLLSNRQLLVYAISKEFFALKWAFRLRRNKVFLQKTWLMTRIAHAIWDGAINRCKDGQLNPKFNHKYASARSAFRSIKIANMLNNFGIKSAFLAHSVYHHRALLSTLQIHGVSTFLHADYKIYRSRIENEAGPFILTKDEWDKFFCLLNPKDVSNYWLQRLRGDTSYDDARLAFQSFSDTQAPCPKNFIMLHIFRDSPYNHIDESRIFVDYIDWIRSTLNTILKSSLEDWCIRLHPSASRWGESQTKWIYSILNELGYRELPINIKLDKSSMSNFEVFSSARRIVTFSGTCHLEAACFGVKPIVISEVSLSSYSSDLVHKPNSKSNYDFLLSQPCESDLFKLSESSQSLALKILFVRDCVLSGFRDMGGIRTYRGDKSEKISEDFSIVSNSLQSRFSYLQDLGRLLAKSDGNSRTVALDYLDKISNLNI